ncbi:MAG: zinc-dependent metalloprotease [Myxococcales bacterium]|nr:zinc-dependent metalloprotease [Myxococcales bacterium]
MRLSTTLALLAAATVGLLAGCAEPVDDINTVQPHYVSKALFEGEWYYKQTITDVSPEVSVGFVGLEGSLEKIRWEIREDQLLAYRVHEAVPGLDQNDNADVPGAEYKGDPVAKFDIIKHFDIRRGYSTSTGEETNEIVENASDRPWHERDYMRIDWGSNNAQGPVDLAGIFTVWSQANDYVRETEIFDPDHLQVTEDYISITNLAVMEADLATCYYSYGGFNCGAGHVRIRSSFAKIDPADAEQFEPREYLDNIPLKDDDGRILRTVSLRLGNGDDVAEFACTPEFMDFLDQLTAPGYFTFQDDCREVRYPQFERFGFFRTERYKYDRRVGGGHDDNREWYANIHNIWKNPVAADGSMRPASERELRPVVYYTNPGYPADLEAVAGRMANDWDEAFIKTAMAATGKTETEIRDQVARDYGVPDWAYFEGDALKQGGMFQIRRNTCSKQGIEAYVAKYPELADVVAEATEGEELLVGNFQRVCAGLTHYSRVRKVAEPFVWQQVGDVRFNHVNWVNEPQPSGPLGYGPSAADPESGRIITGSAHVYGAAIDTYARSAADIVRTMNEDLDLDALISGASYEQWLHQSNTFADMEMELKPGTFDKINARLGGFKVEQAYGDYKLPNGKVDRAALMRQMKRRLDNPHPDDPMYEALHGPVDLGRARLEQLKQDPRFRSRLLTQEHLQLVRPLFGAQPGDEVTDEMEAAAVDLAVDPKAFGEQMRARFKHFSDRNIFMADFIDDSVVGQALEMKGLDPEAVFLRLREQIFRAVMLHEVGHTVGLTHNFQASFDALNYQDEFWQIRDEVPESEWNAARLPEYRYASIMDYGARFNSDTKGLGKYDLAAIKFAYGRVTEVFGDDIDVASTLDFDVFADGYDGIPELLGGDYRNITKRKDVPEQRVMAERRQGVLDNSRVFAANQNTPADEFWFNREVPYEYCFDVFRGNLQCQTWDEGASATEQVRSAIQNYWNYYVFNNYRRGRGEVNFLNSYFSRQDRLSWYLSNPFRYFYFYQQWDIGLRNDLYQASLIGLNFINQVLGTPLPGRHCLDPNTNRYVPAEMMAPGAECEAFDVPIGTGREQFIDLSDEYYYQVDYIGSYYDKVNFLYYLTDTSTSFFQVTNVGDNRAFSIGYYRVYREELLKLVRDMVFAWLGDGEGESFSSLVATEGAPAERITPRALVDKEAFGQDEQMDGMPRLFAPISYNMVWQSLVLMSVFNTSTYDSQTDFSNYLTVVEKGSGEDFETPEGFRRASFTHPRTKVVYEAVQTRDGLSISYPLLQRAQAYVDNVWTPAYDALQESPNDDATRDAFEAADRKLEEYADLIGDLRLLRSAVDWSND